MKKIWCEDMIKKYVEDNNYQYIEMIIEKGLNSKIKIKCPKGHIYEVTFKNFKGNKAKKGTRCPKCSTNKKPEYKQIKELVELNGFKLISQNYINSKEKLEIECKNGHIFERSWNKLKIQNECPYCKMSKGEKRIAKFLDENKIIYFYDKEYFVDLTGVKGNLLRPDFIIPNKKIWIEYDGEFHYDNKISKECFEKLKIHDIRKNIYAKKNNWKLIRIPYWEFDNIEKILIKILDL